MAVDKLIFIYNAKAGKFNALLDTVHKIVSPQTYDCDLCSLTFGAFKEKEEWAAFRKEIDTPLLFLHKDEFLSQYNSKWLPRYTFPIVLAEKNGELHIAITAQRFSKIKRVNELMVEVQNVLGAV